MMKNQSKPKTYSVKLSRGVQGEDGKVHKAGETITCGANLARVIQSCGRGEIVSSKPAPKSD